MDNNISALLKRTSLFLEDESWDEAHAYCERILDMDPENAQAYCYRLLAELKLHSLEELANYHGDIENNNNYRRAVKYANSYLASELNYYKDQIQYQLQKQAEEEAERASRKKALYKKQMLITVSIALVAAIAAAGFYSSYSNRYYKIVEPLMEAAQYEEIRPALLQKMPEEKADEWLYAYAGSLLEEKEYEQAWTVYSLIPDYTDSVEQADQVLTLWVEERAAAEGFEAVLDSLSAIENDALKTQLRPIVNYRWGLELLAAEDYGGAARRFVSANGYMDSAELKQQAYYQQGKIDQENGNYKAAASMFKNAGEYEDAQTLALSCQKRQAQEYIDSNQFKEYFSYVSDGLDDFQPDLPSSKYAAYYNALCDVYLSEFQGELKEDYLYSMSYSVRAFQKAVKMLNLLPDSYKDVKTLKGALEQLYTVLGDSSSNIWNLEQSQINSLKKHWDCDLVQQFLTHDDIIANFMVGNWTGGGYYYTVTLDDDGVWVSWNLPNIDDWNREYIDWQDKDFVALNGDHEVIRKMFKLSFISADSMSVYCYSNGYTYTMYRN